MQQMGLPQIVEAIDGHCVKGDFSRASQLLWPALDQFPQVGALWFYAATIHMGEGRSVPAMQCWQRCYDLEANPDVLVNLGATARLTNQVDLGRAILKYLLDCRPDDVKALGNLCGGFVNEGCPELGIPYGERCLELDPGAKQGRFNLGLLYLENGQYGKGFDCYSAGHHRLRSTKTYTPDPPELTPELFYKFRGKGRMIVLTEQGLGDDLMFSSILVDAAKDFDIILDGHPRLQQIYQLSRFGDKVTIKGTRKVEAPDWSHNADVKCRVGDLGQFYRRYPQDFAWRGPVYKADQAEVAPLRAYLEELADGRPIIGLALRGGTPSTNRRYRGIKIPMLDEFLSQDALFVSLDYEDITEEAQYMLSKGRKFFWSPAILWHHDYIHTAALIAATDRVVTVCQSAAHLAAAMGHRVDVLVPSKPAWRYGLKSERWFWYDHPNARLLRQQGDDWKPAFDQLNVHPLPQEAGELRLSLPDEGQGVDFQEVANV